MTANQQRALRLSGEEPRRQGAARDPWQAADDLVLRKIAQAGFSGLSSMINGTPADAPAVPACAARRQAWPGGRERGHAGRSARLCPAISAR